MPQVIIDYDEYQELLKAKEKYLIVEKYKGKVQHIHTQDILSNTWKSEHKIEKYDIVDLIDELFDGKVTI